LLLSWHPLEEGSSVLERAEKLCKELRDKREKAKKDLHSKEKEKKVEKNDEINKITRLSIVCCSIFLLKLEVHIFWILTWVFPWIWGSWFPRLLPLIRKHLTHSTSVPKPQITQESISTKRRRKNTDVDVDQPSGARTTKNSKNRSHDFPVVCVRANVLHYLCLFTYGVFKQIVCFVLLVFVLTGDEDQPNIVLMRKSQRISQHGTQM
jgi:hypothetical protein